MRMTLPESVDIEELQCVGVTGLMAAAQKYDPAQSSTFAAFATAHIRGAVLDELRRMDFFSRGERAKAKKLQAAIGEIEQRLGRPATEGEISRELKISPEEYSELLEEVKPVSFLQLDAAVSSDEADHLALHETILDEKQIPAREQLEKKELIALVLAQLQRLPEMPKKIMAMYYFEEMRLSEIAAVFGLTEGRISQIHTHTVLGLRSFLQRASSGATSSQACS